MTEVDNLATQYLAELRVPPGPGIEMIQTRGRRRRRRLLAAKLTGAAAASLALIAATLTLLRDESISVSAVDELTVEQDTSREPMIVDLEDELLGLDDWNESQLPTVPTPALPGWTTVVRNVNVTDRFTTHDIGIQYYLRSNGEQLELSVLSGQISLQTADGRAVTLDRPAGPLDAMLSSGGDGSTLEWNERPGLATGTAVVLSGTSADTLLAVATDLTFDDLPLVGASDPDEQTLATDREILLAGTVSGIDWQVSRVGSDLPVLELDGTAPEITSSIVWLGNGLEVALTSVSKDGVQLNMILMPTNGTALLAGSGAKIALPDLTVDEAGYAIAVAPVPAGKQAVAIIVQAQDGRESTLGLPWIAAQGWTTSFSQLRQP